MKASRWLQSRLLLLSWAIAFGIGGLVLAQLLDSRSATWQRAQTANSNLLFTVGRVLEGTLENADHSLRHSVSIMEAHVAAGNARAAAVPDTQLLFAAVPEEGYGIQLVMDHQGRILSASRPPPFTAGTFSERSYFQVHRGQRDTGLFLSAPFRSAYDNEPSVAMSRRWNLPDGRFGGVVVQTLKLAVLYQLFSSFELGPDSGINVFLNSGEVLVRFPYTGEYLGRSLKGTPNFDRFVSEGQGSFTGTAAIDQIERLYVFRTLERFPLVINVAQSTQTILGGWRLNALWLGAATLLLMAGCVLLTFVAERQLHAHRRTAQRLGQAERELRTIVDSLPVLVAYWDHQLVNRMANIAHEDWIGLSPDQMRGRHVSEILDDERRLFIQPYVEATLGGATQVFERDLRDIHGRLRHTLTTFIPDIDEGKVKGLFVLVTDISQRKAAEMALFEEKERFRVTLDSITDAVITTDCDGQVQFLNPAAEAMTGWSLEEAHGRLIHEVMQVESVALGGSRSPGFPENLDPRRDTREKVELMLISRQGERVHIENSAASILDDQGRLLGSVTIFHDSGPARTMANKMIHMAQHDALTGLPNRRRLDLVGQQALSRAVMARHSLAVLYLDLDGFKQVNDEYGHAVGDELLVAVTRRLSTRLRAGDSLYRQGGDEFVVLMESVASANEAERLATRLIESCQMPVSVGEERFAVTVSIGIAMYPEDAMQLAELIQHADRGMYAAKNKGRNRYVCIRRSYDNVVDTRIA